MKKDPKKFNRFHAIVFTTWQFAVMFGVHQLFPIFLNLIPNWRCLMPDNLENNTLYSEIYSKDCRIYGECPKEYLEYDIDYKSAAIEFGWICTTEANYYITAIGSIQYFGVLCGTIFFGSLADYFGRKKVVIFILSFGISMMILSSFTYNVIQLLFARFLIGLTNGGSMVVTTTFVQELIPHNLRMSLKTFVNWNTARLVATWVCYYTADWRTSTIYWAILSLPSVFIVIFVLPESPPYLYSKKKFDDLKKVQMYIAKMGKTEYVDLVPPTNVSEARMSYFEILTNSKARILISVLCVMWFTASVTSYTNDLNSTAIPGGFWFVQILSSITGIIASFGLGIFDLIYPKLNRRNLHHYNQFIAILCFIAVGALFYFKYEGFLLMTMYMIGYMCIGCTWDACYLCTIESVPTSVRGAALGSCSLVARFGALLAPLVALLASIWQPGAYMIVCVLGIINLTLSWLFLPDTKGIDLSHVKVKLHIPDENIEKEPIKEAIYFKNETVTFDFQ